MSTRKLVRAIQLALALGTGVVVVFYIMLLGPTVPKTVLGLKFHLPSFSIFSPHLAKTNPSDFIGTEGEITGFLPPISIFPSNNLPRHTKIISQTTRDGHYFNITFNTAISTFNPNILPNPQHKDRWIILAQLRNWDHRNPKLGPAPSVEVVCTTATFLNDTLTCTDDGGSIHLPVEPTTTSDPELCKTKLGLLDLSLLLSNKGPHDARMFYGPDAPYILYGSNSHFTCFSQWLQDLRALLPEEGMWDAEEALETTTTTPFKFSTGTELQRPSGVSPFKLEKNWFLFWAASDHQPYVHYDIAPVRSFAPLRPDGSVGPASNTTFTDTVGQDGACLERYLPGLGEQGPASLGSIHQATNSLAVTICRRADQACSPTDDNTFLMVIVQHKTFNNLHGSYRPYVVLFRQRAPFAVWAVSRQPLWFSGRRAAVERLRPGSLAASEDDDDRVEKYVTEESFYVTSMGWRAHELRYHGFVDDVVFVAFGIEDRRSAGIDVLAGDLLGNLGLCEDTDG